MTFRPMPVLSLLSVLGLAILIWLGNWQWGRYQEKLHRPTDIPVSQFVRFTGETGDHPAQFVYTTYGGEALWRVFQSAQGCVQPETGSESCDKPVFVNVTLLSTLKPEDIDFRPEAKTFASGDFVIIPNRSHKIFSPQDFPDKAQWYVVNAAAMAEALAIPGAETALLLEPKMIDLVRLSPTGEQIIQTIENPYANPAKMDDLPPERHLGYALTWYGLAGTLIAVYLAFHITTGRLRFGRTQTN